MTTTTLPTSAVTPEVAAQLFTEARSAFEWMDTPVDDAPIKAAWEMAMFGPTAMNIVPLRFKVVRGAEAKAKLIPCMGEFNQPKVQAAPVSLLLGYDTDFHTLIPELFPIHPEVADALAGQPEAREGMARANGLLQAAYFMIALRAVGLAVGPMNGMDFDAVTDAFWPGDSVKAFLVVNVGFAKGPGTPFPRLPRLTFDRVAEVL